MICSFPLLSQGNLIIKIDTSHISATDKHLLDSFLSLYHQAPHDTLKYSYIRTMTENCQDEKIWLPYNHWLRKEAEKKLKEIAKLSPTEKKYYLSLWASAVNNLGYYHKSIGNIDKALQLYEQAIKAQEMANDREGLSVSYNNIGTTHYHRGNYGKASEYLYKAVKINEALKETLMTAYSYLNLAMVYETLSEYNLSFDYLFRALAIFQEKKHHYEIAITLNNIGKLYLSKNMYEQAKQYFLKSYQMKETYQLPLVQGALINLSKVYYYQNDYVKSLYYGKKAQQELESQKNKIGLSAVYLHLSAIYLAMNNIAMAKQYAILSYELAQTLKLTDDLAESALLLSKIYATENKPDKAIEMIRIYTEKIKEQYSEENKKTLIQQKTQYEMDKKQAIKEAEWKNNMMLAKEQEEKQRIALYSAIGILCMLFILLYVIYNRLKVTNQQKKKIIHQHFLLEQKNKDITDSINYAKRIQEALIKKSSRDFSMLDQHFIFFQPKDIVSGDFYWSKKTKTGNDTCLYLSVADCTGHGVPGAFMTILGLSFLNDIVDKKKNISTHEILNTLKNKIIAELNTENIQSKDGMDISLVKYLPYLQQIQWSGAFNPLYITTRDPQHYISQIESQKYPCNIQEDNTTCLIELLPDKFPVGLHYQKEEQSFSYITLTTLKGDMIYLCSDGFADQFGGEKGKKYKTRQLKKLLLSLYDCSMEQQYNAVSTEFNQWKGTIEQTDDVTLMGFRIC